MTRGETIESRLCGLFGYGHAVLFGRARSGLVALLEALGPERTGAVVIPSNICPAALAALVAGDAEPRLAPVSPESGLADDARLAAAMSRVARPGMAMPTHLYGMRADYTETRRLAAAKGWFVLENDTLATAAAPDGVRRAFGDALLVSFGSAKTIEAGGGGAVLTDDARLAGELARRARRWPEPGAEAEAVETHLTLARRHLRALGRPDLAEPLLPLDAGHCRYGFADALRAPLGRALERLPETIATRRERLQLWDRALAPFAASLMQPPIAPAAPWRAIRRLRDPARRGPVVEALRDAGFDAGTNYPPLAESFPALLGGQGHPDATEWGRAVINLWLDERYDAARIARAAEVIGGVLCRSQEFAA